MFAAIIAVKPTKIKLSLKSLNTKLQLFCRLFINVFENQFQSIRSVVANQNISTTVGITNFPANIFDFINYNSTF